MEKLQVPINSCLLQGHSEPSCLEDVNCGMGFPYPQFEEFSQQHFTLPSLEDKANVNVPFLQMLQSVEYPLSAAIQDPNFQFLLRLQQQTESCVTTNEIKSEIRAQPPNSTENLRSELKSGRSRLPKSSPVIKERRKRKRTRPTKNKEEVESQRMTHIAVERNRRRQMNDHLNVLRALMPPSYIQRGDQASIIGGAIDFVKELEQLLQSLQAKKRMRLQSDQDSATSSCSSSSNFLSNCTSISGGKTEEFTAENRSSVAEIEAVLIHNHVNMKIQCQRRQGQLVKAILAMEELRLTVLHLNITSLRSLVHYSFNLKVEDDCQLRSAEEIAEAVHQIFTHINSC